MDFYVEERSYSAEDKEVGIGLNQNKKHWIKHLQKKTQKYFLYMVNFQKMSQCQLMENVSLNQWKTQFMKHWPEKLVWKKQLLYISVFFASIISISNYSWWPYYYC